MANEMLGVACAGGFASLGLPSEEGRSARDAQAPWRGRGCAASGVQYLQTNCGRWDDVGGRETGETCEASVF